MQLKQKRQQLYVNTKIVKHHSHMHLTFNGSFIGINDSSDNLSTNSQVIIVIPKNEVLSKITQNKRGVRLSLTHLHVDKINVNGVNENNKLDHVIANQKIVLKDVEKMNYVNAPSIDINDFNNDLIIRNSSFDKQASSINVYDNDFILSHNKWNHLTIVDHDGDIHFKQQTTKNSISMKANDGDIDGQITPSKHNFINAKADYGDTNIYNHKNYNNITPLYTYNLETQDGDINIRR